MQAVVIVIVLVIGIPIALWLFGALRAGARGFKRAWHDFHDTAPGARNFSDGWRVGGAYMQQQRAAAEAVTNRERPARRNQREGARNLAHGLRPGIEDLPALPGRTRGRVGAGVGGRGATPCSPRD